VYYCCCCQIFLLVAQPSYLVTALFRIHMHCIYGATIAVVLPVVNTRLVCISLCLCCLKCHFLFVYNHSVLFKILSKFVIFIQIWFKIMYFVFCAIFHSFIDFLSTVNFSCVFKYGVRYCFLYSECKTYNFAI